MEREFTPGVERALAEAATWTSGEDSDELSAPSVLLGLLAETECRAAIMLARHGVDAETVRTRWPDLSCLPTPVELIPRFSADVEASLVAAAERLHEYPKPLTLATEHVLLGLAAADHATAAWLQEQGLDADVLEAEIHRQYGHRPGPLPLEEEPLDYILEENKPPDAPPANGPPDSPPTQSPPIESPLRESPPPGPPETPPAHQIRFLRVFDAAANRAREGLRVVEDYVRFVLDDQHLTERLKHLRHDLRGLLERISVGDRLAARETQADVGTDLSTASERHREDTAGVLAANFARLQESLRSLEEFGKLIDEDLAAELQQLRYRSYTLQRAIEITGLSLQRLAGARLYVLIDGGRTEQEFESAARSLVAAGVHVLQLRDKRLDDRRLFERARLLRQITRRGETLMILNDRPDVAVLSAADGVHVGQEELAAKEARTIVGPEALVGVSVHSIEQARRAVMDGANYMGVGPTFPSGTKHFDEYPGVELLRKVAAEIRLPAFAIGGVNGQTLPEVFDAGFNRIAVSSAVTKSDDPPAAARELLAALGD